MLMVRIVFRAREGGCWYAWLRGHGAEAARNGTPIRYAAAATPPKKIYCEQRRASSY